MTDLIARTRTLFAEGMPLARMVQGRLSIDLEMFSRGGLAVLDAIEATGYDTLHHRPAISKSKQARLLGRALVLHLIGRNSKPDDEASRTSALAGAQQAALEASVTIPESYEERHPVAHPARSNFYYAFFLLPKAKQDALVALYAFMRLVDDVADEAGDLAANQRGLAKWRGALDSAINHDSPVPIR